MIEIKRNVKNGNQHQYRDIDKVNGRFYGMNISKENREKISLKQFDKKINF